MKISSNIAHTAELSYLIDKSPEPADRLASKYFRAKKYIGSKDRRFISETVFLSQRIKLLADHCNQFAITDLQHLIDIDPGNPVFKNKNFNQNLILFHFAVIFISMNYPTNILNYNADNLFSDLTPGENSGPRSLLENAFYELFLKKDKLFDQFYDNTINELKKLLLGEDQIKMKDNLDTKDIDLLTVRYSIPAWIINSLLESKYKYYSIDTFCGVLESFTGSAPVGIRVNFRKAGRDEIAKQLDNKDIDYRRAKLSPAGIIMNQRYPLNQTNLYKSGAIEIQDEGSQLISYAVNPSKSWRILDACAGAGGKTLHLADIQEDNGHIISADVDFRKLRELKKRKNRASLNSIDIYQWGKDNAKSKQLKEKYFSSDFDAVLIDAPCSGLGTIRRMPLIKYRRNESVIKRHADSQLDLLNEYSCYVRRGGTLVYATCSIMPEENEQVVKRFLDYQPDFEPLPLWDACNKYGIIIPGMKKSDFCLSLNPYEHDTDGFFMARMRRCV